MAKTHVNQEYSHRYIILSAAAAMRDIEIEVESVIGVCARAKKPATTAQQRHILEINC